MQLLSCCNLPAVDNHTEAFAMPFVQIEFIG